MAKIIDLKSFLDERGCLTVIDNVLPFDIKRVFYIYDANNAIRGGHRHKRTKQALICLQGSCIVINQSPLNKESVSYLLDSPAQCLIIEPEDFHWMNSFSNNCILMVFASESYDHSDYIFEPYF